jgi:hypothetical protein
MRITLTLEMLRSSTRGIERIWRLFVFAGYVVCIGSCFGNVPGRIRWHNFSLSFEPPEGIDIVPCFLDVDLIECQLYAISNESWILTVLIWLHKSSN